MAVVMDIGPAIVWAAGLSSLLSLGTAIWTVLSAPARKTEARLNELEARLDTTERNAAERFAAVDRGLQRVSDQLQAVPSTETMHRLELSLARMDGHIGRIDERLRPVTAIAERMQDLLIERGGPTGTARS